MGVPAFHNSSSVVLTPFPFSVTYIAKPPASDDSKTTGECVVLRCGCGGQGKAIGLKKPAEPRVRHSGHFS